MRDQYAGDVSDAVKLALLRSLAGQDRRLGVAWYYVSGNDGRADGRHMEWLDDASWSKIDGDLQAAIGQLPSRNVSSLEGLSIWPENTRFHRVPIPTGGERLSWAREMRATLASTDLIFIDPDDGVGQAGVKHATWGEVRGFVGGNRCVVFIKFPGRSSHSEQAIQLHEMAAKETGCDNIVTLRTNVSVPATKSGCFVPRIRWFTLINPCKLLHERLETFADAINACPRMSAVVQR